MDPTAVRSEEGTPEAYRRALKELLEQIRRRDERLQWLRRHLENLTHDLARLRERAEPTESELAGARAALAAGEERIRALEGELGAREREARALESELAGARAALAAGEERIRALEGELGVRDRRVTGLEGELRKLSEHIAELGAALARWREEQARALEQVRQEVGDQLSLLVVRSGVLWRVVAPVRALVRRIRHRFAGRAPRLVVDEPNLSVRPRLSGKVRVTGWAASGWAEVERVEVLCDGHLIGDATLGLPRPDVGAAWPELHAADRSGFTLDWDLDGVPPGWHELTVRARDRQGRLATKTGTVFVEGTLGSYQMWLHQHELTPADLHRLAIEAQRFPYKPLISVIMPVRDPEERDLREAIASVLRQLYPQWELCIADDASSKPYVRRILQEYARKDSRIKITFLSERLHISGASNEAMSLAQGEFLGFLDHDDSLSPDALFEVVRALNDDPEIDIFYSDEDRLSPQGLRTEPFFKPDWSPDLLLSYNYMCHFRVYRRSLVERVGGHRPGYEGSQDYDLLLRLTEVSQKVHHIPKVLYHWRQASGSAATHAAAKPYAYEAGKRALSEALKRRGIRATVSDGLFPGSYRVSYAVEGEPLVSIIIATKDRLDLLVRCIESVLGKTAYPRYEVVVVDNGSQEEATKRYLHVLGQRRRFRVLDYPRPFNFSAVNNFAASQAQGQYLLFLNNDTEVINEDWLTALLEHAQRKAVGAVGARLYFLDGRLQHGGVILGLGGVAGHAHKYLPKGMLGYFGRAAVIQNFSAVTAACMMVPAHVFAEVGGYDEEHLPIAFGDVDLCLRIRERGYLIVWTPYAELYHHESATRGPEDTPEKAERFRREVEYMKARWGDVLFKDPYYNPNLTLDSEDFQLRLEG